MVNMFVNRYIKKIGFVVVIIMAGLLLLENFAEAQTYQIHEQIPGQAGKSGTINGTNYGEAGVDTLQDYLESAYKFGIAIVAILAVVMIGVGGFMYIVTSAGNAGKLANAKEIITSAILGLVMALLSWLILFVINPDLVGNALKGIKFDNNNDDWKHDRQADPKICNIEGKLYYETLNCEGDYFCVKDTCVNKKSSCLPSGVKFPGVCSKDDFVIAHQGERCGVVTGNNEELAGTCYPRTCEGGLVELTSGKKCVDTGNHCCTRGL